MTGNRYVLRFFSLVLSSFILLQLIIPAGGNAELTDTIQLTATDDGETWPRIVDDTDGNIHIVYLFSSDVNQLHYRKISRAGSTIVGPVVLNKVQHELYSRYDYDLAIDDDGRIHVIFHAFTEVESHLYYVQLSKLGKVVVPAKRVDCSSDEVDHPDIDVDGLGNVFVVFNDRVSRPSIRWLQLDSEGGVLSSEKTVSDMCFDVWTPKVSVTPSGISYIIWLQQNTRVEKWGLFFTRLSPAGNREISPVRVDQSSLLSDKSYIMADLDREGFLHITYMQDDNIYYAQVNSNGSPIVDHLLVTQSTTGDPGTSDLVVSISGDAYIVYEYIEEPDDLRYEIDLRVYWKENNTLGTETVLHTSDVPPEDPCISVSDDNIIEIVYWQWDLIQDLYLIVIGAEDEDPPPINGDIPIARISEIYPNPAVENQVISFSGSGIDSKGTIIAYRWESNLDGFLSDKRDFTTSQLSVGNHLIRFQVQDNDNIWSDYSTEELFVMDDFIPIRIMTFPTEGRVNQELEFVVTYRNDNNTLPVYSRLYYGKKGVYDHERLVEVDPQDHNSKDGKDYHVKLRFHESGVHSIYFEFYNDEDGEQLSESREISITDEGGIMSLFGLLFLSLIILLAILIIRYKK